MENAPSVSVVIPTTGRVSLHQAVASALMQTLAPLEVVVVDDRPAYAPALDGLPPEVVVVRSVGATGPSAARMLGVRRARGHLVAFLDDDDVWEPEKLERQVAWWSSEADAGREAVVGCRVRVVDEHGRTRAVVPEREQGTDDVITYVFRRTSLRPVGFALGSSTLLASRALLEKVPLDHELLLHEDWDWVLRVSRRPGVVITVLAEPLLRYRDAREASAASRPSGGWRSSLAWVDGAGLPARERGDLLLTVTAGLALADHDRRRALTLALHALRTARPGWRAVVGLLLQTLLPADLLRRVAAAIGRRRALTNSGVGRGSV